MCTSHASDVLVGFSLALLPREAHTRPSIPLDDPEIILERQKPPMQPRRRGLIRNVGPSSASQGRFGQLGPFYL